MPEPKEGTFRLIARKGGERPSLQPDEDAADVAVARARLAEIDAHPERVLRGPALEARMRKWES